MIRVMKMLRTYSELIKMNSFEDRFNYLKLSGNVGESTFGFDRIFNQSFYRSKEWKDLRHWIIVRDEGNDLGIFGREIFGPIHVHHMNPVNLDDIRDNRELILDPEFLICTSSLTHKAIHYSNEDILYKDLVDRKPGDTKLW